jgi:glucose dehydrogenase
VTPPGGPSGAEVAIIGAGAAGGILALELARRGVQVIVLESGPRHEFARRPEYVRRLLDGENPWATPLAGLDTYTTSGEVPYPLEGNRARGVGGSTLHWEGYTLRLGADDFRLRSVYGVADDWPISYDDLEPYYARAEDALGVAGDADDPWGSARSTPYPLPPFPFSYCDGRFVGACRALGIAVHHLPQARNSVAYGGRSPCRACSTCHACPTGAKASIDLTHIPQAEATGRARVLTELTAVRLEVNRSPEVQAIVCLGADKLERRVSAPVVVVAGGAVETARLLLLSASPEFPQGLANGSGRLGKYFMSHPVVTVTGRLPDKVYPYRVGFSTAMTRQFAVERDRARQGAFFLEFLNSAGPKPEQIAVGSRRWGAALRQHVQQEFGRTLGIRAYCEQLPDIANSVSLDRGVTDYFGNPVPHITYGVGAYERTALREAEQVGRRILEQLGAVDIQSSGLRLAGHQLGTHRMGADPRSSVVDATLRAHEVPNLYLVGAGCFVTGSPSPPTLTIAALAIRAAERIASSLRARTGSAKLAVVSKESPS